MCTSLGARVTSQAFGRVEPIPPPDAEVRNHTPSSVHVTPESPTQSDLHGRTYDSGCSVITSTFIGNLPYNCFITSSHQTHSAPIRMVETPFPNAFRSSIRKGRDTRGCSDTNDAIISCAIQDPIFHCICTTRWGGPAWAYFAVPVRRITMTIWSFTKRR